MKTLLRYGWPVALVLLIQSFALSMPVKPGVSEPGRLILFGAVDVLVSFGQWVNYKSTKRRNAQIEELRAGIRKGGR